MNQDQTLDAYFKQVGLSFPDYQKVNNYNVGGYHKHRIDRLKVLRKTDAILWLIQQNNAFLLKYGFDWPIKAKKLIKEKGWSMSTNRFRFQQIKDKAALPRKGLFLRNRAGMGHTIYEVTSTSACGTYFTYRRKYLTNYGFPMISPDQSVGRGKMSLSQFENSGYVLTEIVE